MVVVVVLLCSLWLMSVAVFVSATVVVVVVAVASVCAVCLFVAVTLVGVVVLVLTLLSSLLHYYEYTININITPTEACIPLAIGHLVVVAAVACRVPGARYLIGLTLTCSRLPKAWPGLIETSPSYGNKEEVPYYCCTYLRSPFATPFMLPREGLHLNPNLKNDGMLYITRGFASRAAYAARYARSGKKVHQIMRSGQRSMIG